MRATCCITLGFSNPTNSSSGNTWANGLQNVSPGTNPAVKATLDSKKKRIAIQDNGRGMDWVGLHNFFVMHGENIDRREGRIGRGMFGTGKSAAFGIADVLRITTIKGCRRSKVELKRSEIEKMKSDDPISVKVIEREIANSAPDGSPTSAFRFLLSPATSGLPPATFEVFREPHLEGVRSLY